MKYSIIFRLLSIFFTLLNSATFAHEISDLNGRWRLDDSNSLGYIFSGFSSDPEVFAAQPNAKFSLESMISGKVIYAGNCRFHKKSETLIKAYCTVDGQTFRGLIERFELQFVDTNTIKKIDIDYRDSYFGRREEAKTIIRHSSGLKIEKRVAPSAKGRQDSLDTQLTTEQSQVESSLNGSTQ